MSRLLSRGLKARRPSSVFSSNSKQNLRPRAQLRNCVVGFLTDRILESLVSVLVRSAASLNVTTIDNNEFVLDKDCDSIANWYISFPDWSIGLSTKVPIKPFTQILKKRIAGGFCLLTIMKQSVDISL